MTSPSRRQARPLARRLAAALGLSAVVLGGVAACSEEVPDRDTAPAAADTAKESPSDEPTQTDSPTDDTTADPSETVVPLYFVGDTPQGPRLFREFRSVPADNPLMEATALLLAGDTLDPDYRTLWPQVEIAGVEATDGVLLAHVAGDGFTERPDGMSPKVARLAIQQLVHTLQGVQQERVPVQFHRD